MNFRFNNITVIFLLALALFFLWPAFAYSSATDGTIDSNYKYGWGENIGWINFGVSGGNVHVTDAGLTGYGWSANYGWINLSPATAGVKNDGNGNLSGNAWGENLGWINFGGVTISGLGEFWGYAKVENTNSRIVFNCNNTSSCSTSNFKVKTDWRPVSGRPAGGSVAISQPASQPAAAEEAAPLAEPEIIAPLPEKMPEKTPTAKIEPVTKQAPGAAETSGTYGAKDQAAKPAVKEISPLEQVLSKLKDIFAPILAKLTPLKPLTPPEIPIEKLVPKEAPLALRGQWQIMPSEPAEKFALAPLPAEFKKLAEKFPSLNKIFEDFNISKIADIGGLNNIALTLPGLTAAANLPRAEVAPEKFAWLQGLPLANLTAEIKKNLPSEIVFAKTGGELIDYNIDLTINEQGRPQQRITASANQSLKLVVKPEGKVNAVKGYLVFKSAGGNPVSRLNAEPFSRFIKPALASPLDRLAAGRLQDFFASFIFSRPGLAFPQKNPVPVEEKLVLEEFDYADPDGDGLYTAEIKTPAAEGEYEIITVLSYKDPEQGVKAIKLTTVIDPEGYVYEKIGDKELRIPGAVISLYWLNPETKQYEIWPAQKYNQENQQITDVSGKYLFLTPPGSYYLKIEAPGYLTYEGKPFQVKAGGAVHANIELKTKYGWFKNFDWKTIALILTIIFLFYNFYKDKLRNKRI